MGAQQSKDSMVFHGNNVPVSISKDLLENQASEPVEQNQIDPSTIKEQVESMVNAELSRYFVEKQLQAELLKERFYTSDLLISEMKQLKSKISESIEQNDPKQKLLDVVATKQAALASCLRSNQKTPLNCSDVVAEFSQLAKRTETLF
ncbi:hypothetical protein AYI70_g2268 [Smittium culicis]|uniref:Uncharacterized protein n=1 Tax=Smittium culicis TaxID=133412 RepID=A0A1R1Y8Z8_9FUNG|nr:hypothetical protein AYI70_g2268 [Smittium culicis]